MRNFVHLSRVAFFVALFAITALAFVPQEQAAVDLGWDKANHCVAFFVLLMLLDFAYLKQPMLLAKFLPLLLYGVLIEAIQSLLAYREGSLLDIVADVAGLCTYLIIKPTVCKLLKLYGLLPSLQNE